MDLSNKFNEPPPYSRLDEESSKNNNSAQLSPERPLEEARVTIGMASDISIARKNNDTHHCLLLLHHIGKAFLCGCSLRAGCITLAVLYFIYETVTFLLVTVYIIKRANHESTSITLLMSNVVGFDFTLALFIIVFLCIGIHKNDPRRIHVAKWFMVLEMICTVIEGFNASLQHDTFQFVFHLVILVIPTYFVMIVHSFEAQLEEEHQKCAQNATAEASFSNAKHAKEQQESNSSCNVV